MCGFHEYPSHIHIFHGATGQGCARAVRCLARWESLAGAAVKFALWRVRFFRLLSRVALRALSSAEDAAISRAKIIYGGEIPGWSCHCGECWREWLWRRSK